MLSLNGRLGVTMSSSAHRHAEEIKDIRRNIDGNNNVTMAEAITYCRGLLPGSEVERVGNVLWSIVSEMHPNKSDDEILQYLINLKLD